MKNSLIILLIGIAFFGCGTKNDESIVGKYEVTTLLDGQKSDDDDVKIWQFDSLYFWNIADDMTQYAQSYKRIEDTIFLYNSFLMKNTGQIRNDLANEHFFILSHSKDSFLLQSTFAKSLTFLLKKIDKPTEAYFDTTKVSTSPELKEKLRGSWSMYTNVLEDKFNEDFSYLRFEFEENICTRTTKNTNLEPIIFKYRVYLIDEDELVLIPIKEFIWDNGAITKGNRFYEELKIKIIKIDSNKLEMDWTIEGQSLIFERDDK